jgi:hypothetical protein
MLHIRRNGAGAHAGLIAREPALPAFSDLQVLPISQ